MRDLRLDRLIPVAAACALTFVSCGGKATDGGGDGDGEGDGDGDNSFARPGLAGSFDRKFEQALKNACEKQVECYDDYYGYGYADVEECVDEVSAVLETAYNLDSSTCQRLMLEALECSTEGAECYYSSDECYEVIYSLFEECFDYDYFDYYDY